MTTKELEVPTYLVERYLPSGGSLNFSSVSQQARRGADESRSEGVDISYLGSTHSTDDEMCFCLYEAPSAEAVRHANERVGLPVERISEAELSTYHAALRRRVQPGSSASTD